LRLATYQLTYRSVEITISRAYAYPSITPQVTSLPFWV